MTLPLYMVCQVAVDSRARQRSPHPLDTLQQLHHSTLLSHHGGGSLLMRLDLFSLAPFSLAPSQLLSICPLIHSGLRFVSHFFHFFIFF